MADGGGDPEYKVGRGKPPLRTRIQVGEVRNPYGCKGKPKPVVKAKPQLAYDALEKALSREVSALQANGQKTKMTAKDALYAKVVNDAMRGEPRAQRLIFSLLKDQQKGLPTPSDVPTGAVVLREPAHTIEEWMDSAEEYKKSLPKDRWADMPGYDPVTQTFQGMACDTVNGGFLRSKAALRKVEQPLEGNGDED